MLEVVKQQTKLYTIFLDKISRDSTDPLATTFVPDDIVSKSGESVCLTATTSHFKSLKKEYSFVVELCTPEGLTAQLRSNSLFEGLTAQLKTESATDVKSWDTIKKYDKVKTINLFKLYFNMSKL